MWCAVELVRKLGTRQEVLASNLTHHERGLPGLELFFLVSRMGFSPSSVTRD
jgi:hypothetical protein